jgi:hypothetical protein
MDDADLARVVGGGSTAPNVSTYKGKDGTEVSQQRTDFAYCVDAVKQNCRDANPGMFWGTNEGRAAQCTLDNLPKACPPSLSGGTSP